MLRGSLGKETRAKGERGESPGATIYCRKRNRLWGAQEQEN